jgi:hypothetical protein
MYVDYSLQYCRRQSQTSGDAASALSAMEQLRLGRPKVALGRPAPVCRRQLRGDVAQEEEEPPSSIDQLRVVKETQPRGWLARRRPGTKPEPCWRRPTQFIGVATPKRYLFLRQYEYGKSVLISRAAARAGWFLISLARTW